MSQTSALYGFEFTRPFTAAGMEFQPIETKYAEAKRLARSLKSYELTGTVTAPELSDQTLFQLAGVLSFIERLDVAITDPVTADDILDNREQYFQPTLARLPRNNGGGAVIGSDAFGHWRDSRGSFIDLAMERLRDTTFCKNSRFHFLLFKYVETFRQRQTFLEISYFLLMSGLEAFARGVQNDHETRNGAEPITRLLKHYGFNVYQDNPNELARSISTYSHIRNALYHQGDFSANVQINDTLVTLNCSDYLSNLSLLASLTILKAVGFEDHHTNWDGWISHQLHT